LGVAAPVVEEAELALAATVIQWLNVETVIGVPLTLATALPGTPLLPHAVSTNPVSETAPSAAI
jgi:hypothetical protein